MRLPIGTDEPRIETWQPAPLAELIDMVTPVNAQARVLAIDGRSANGKSTLARRLNGALPGSALISTDDVAWNFSMFDWADELAEHVVLPARRGLPISYRPPGWRTHGRAGSIELPANLDLLIIEGVGASQRDLFSGLDASIWVQADVVDARDRGLRRDIDSGVNGDAAASTAFWEEWMAVELPFLEEDRPWRRASVVAAGGPVIDLAPDQVAVARTDV